MKVKISIIGAGSAIFSLRLVGDICRSSELRNSLVSLMDIDEKRLWSIYTLAKRYAEELGAKVEFERTTDIERSIDGADFVINTALVGGHEQMEIVRKVGERYGYYRGIDAQEFNFVSDYYTFSNYNQLKFFLNVAKLVEKLSPSAWLLQTANPVFEGTNLIYRLVDVKVVGLCHGFHDVFVIMRTLGLDEKEIDWQIAGFNHAIWLTRFRKDGEDLYPLIDEWIEKKSADWKPKHPFDVQMSPTAIDMYRFYGRFPVGDTVRNGSWKYNRDLKTKMKWFGEPWGGPDSEIGWEWYHNRVSEIATIMQKVAEYLERDPKMKLLSEETKSFVLESMEKHDGIGNFVNDVFRMFDPEKMSGEQHVPFMESIVGGKKHRLFLNIPNEPRVIDGLPKDVIVEVPVLVDEDGIHPEKIEPPIPKRILKFYLIPRMMRMELSYEAFTTGDRRILEEVLMRDPRTTSHEQVVKVLDAILSLPFNADMRKHYHS